MNGVPQWLPEMICVSGVWEEVLLQLYSIFEKDFKQGRPTFEGRPVWYDRRVEPGDSYEEGFWHLIAREQTTKRGNEVALERLPDFRRAERLPWCAPTIQNSADPIVRVWDYVEAKGKVRTYVWLENLDYVVVLQKRKKPIWEVAFLVTAFHVDGKSKRRNLTEKYARRRK